MSQNVSTERENSSGENQKNWMEKFNRKIIEIIWEHLYYSWIFKFTKAEGREIFSFVIQIVAKKKKKKESKNDFCINSFIRHMNIVNLILICYSNYSNEKI